MKQKVSLLVFSALLAISVRAQDVSSQVIEKAVYPGENLTGFLTRNVRYPSICLQRKVEGDVILSYVINSDGNLDSLIIIKSPYYALSSSAMETVKLLNEKWTPARIDNKPVNSRYLTVFRYRIWTETSPVNYHKQVQDLFREGKYDKALKMCDRGLKDNKYDWDLMEYRSQIKRKLGDTPGAEKDQKAALLLSNQIMSVVDVNAFGVVRKPVVIGTEIVKIPR